MTQKVNQLVNQLLSTIKKAEKEVGRLQGKCKHKTLRHKSFRDIYQGQGVSTECADCGKFISCASIPVLSNDEIISKTWIERKK